MPFTYRTSALSHEGYRAQISVLEPELPIAVGTIDVDRFDLINSAEGHEVGDQVLAEVEQALLTGLPGGALVAHVKGDEWHLALPDAAPEELLIALDGVRRQLAATGRVTITGGVAGRPNHGADLEELLSAADTAQVRAKQAGGNRIAIATEERMVLKSSYYGRPALHRLAKLASRTGRTEASHLREALDEHLARHREIV